MTDTPTEGAEPTDVDIAVVTLTFEASDADALLAALSKYVVLARGEPGCRNVDLCGSVARPNRFVVIEKWESDDHARSHFDTPVAVEMAHACEGLLAGPPAVELLAGLSVHDLA